MFKDKSLAPHCIRILNTMLARFFGDRMPLTDSLSYIYMYIVYALRGEIRVSDIVKVYLQCGPDPNAKQFGFTSFPQVTIASQLKQLILGKVKLQTFPENELHKQITPRLNDLLVERLALIIEE
jgi:hypothetical protein